MVSALKRCTRTDPNASCFEDSALLQRRGNGGGRGRGRGRMPAYMQRSRHINMGKTVPRHILRL